MINPTAVDFYTRKYWVRYYLDLPDNNEYCPGYNAELINFHNRVTCGYSLDNARVMVRDLLQIALELFPHEYNEDLKPDFTLPGLWELI